MSDQIPKARQLYKGDINDAVTQVQKVTGIEIDKDWWDAKVGSDDSASAESILDKFDEAYAELVAEKSQNS